MLLGVWLSEFRVETESSEPKRTGSMQCIQQYQPHHQEQYLLDTSNEPSGTAQVEASLWAVRSREITQTDSSSGLGCRVLVYSDINNTSSFPKMASIDAICQNLDAQVRFCLTCISETLSCYTAEECTKLLSHFRVSLTMCW